MKKQIILYIIKTAISIEIIFMLAVVIICQETKDFSKYWLILLEFQIPTVCIVAFSTVAFHESYLNEIDDLRLQKKLNEIKKDMKSNKEFMDCWNEFKKRNGETMKYIRTKDGILKVDGYDDRGVCVCRGKTFYRDEYIKQADTIEELCDGFYLDDGQEEFCLDDVFTNFDKFKSSYIYNNKYHIVKYEGYGFIKTSKGLMYVAKMNDEGKLCLI